MNRKTLAAAFPLTLPVLMGYLAIGVAFGLMLQSAGWGVGWAALMSLTIYAGSGQYLGVSLLAAGAPLTQVAFLTLMVNFRHLVYGLSMLEKFRGMGLRKLYMIFSLTDETYALLSSARAPEGVDKHDFFFTVALLDQSYWVLGSVIGSLLGAALAGLLMTLTLWPAQAVLDALHGALFLAAVAPLPLLAADRALAPSAVAPASSAVNRPSLPWIAPSAASSEPLASAGAALRGSGDDRPASLAAAEIDGGEATYEVIDEMSEELL